MRSPMLAEPIIKSFYSGPMYRAALARWHWKALGYAVLLCAILSFMFVAKLFFFVQSLEPVMTADLPVFEKNIVEVSMKETRLFVQPVKDTITEQNGAYTIIGKDGKPLAIINPTEFLIPPDLGGAKYYLSKREAGYMVDGGVRRIAFIPEFSIIFNSGAKIFSRSDLILYCLKVYPIWLRDRIRDFLILSFLFVIPMWGVMRYFGMKLPFAKMIVLSILSLTPAVVTDVVSITVFNKDVIDLVIMSIITILYQLFICYKITKLEQDELEIAEKSSEGKGDVR
jgi:hypothetical protein